eukprot:7276750-Prymnesium_polylepis.1
MCKQPPDDVISHRTITNAPTTLLMHPEPAGPPSLPTPSRWDDAVTDILTAPRTDARTRAGWPSSRFPGFFLEIRPLRRKQISRNLSGNMTHGKEAQRGNRICARAHHPLSLTHEDA